MQQQYARLATQSRRIPKPQVLGKKMVPVGGARMPEQVLITRTYSTFVDLAFRMSRSRIIRYQTIGNLVDYFGAFWNVSRLQAE